MTDYDILPKKVRAKGPGSEASSRVILGWVCNDKDAKKWFRTSTLFFEK